MYRYQFFVNVQGWQINAENGKRGYFNTGFAATKAEALRTIKQWNDESKASGVDCIVDFISGEVITQEAYKADCIAL